MRLGRQGGSAAHMWGGSGGRGGRAARAAGGRGGRSRRAAQAARPGGRAARPASIDPSGSYRPAMGHPTGRAAGYRQKPRGL